MKKNLVQFALIWAVAPPPCSFFDGEVLPDSLPVGGAHVTNDIARGLSPVAYAERMKTLYGSANPTPSDDQEHFKIPLVGERKWVQSSSPFDACGHHSAPH